MAPEPGRARHSRPGFFLAGAPKCGTTALYRYLASHPRVFLPVGKEPHFFDQPENALAAGLDAYLDRFAAAGPQHDVIGEGSTGYLSSPIALENIRRFRPDARIAVMLRNPLELVAALHAEYCFQRFEDEPDLEVAWSLQEARRRGERLPRANPRGIQVRMLQYEAVARLGEQVARLLDVFHREQVHLVLFDDFVRAPAECYAEVLRFLGLPPDGRSHFPTVNPRRRLRWPRIARLVAQPPRAVSSAALALKARIGIRDRELLRPLRAALDRLNEAPASRHVLSPAFRAELVAAFGPDVEFLGRLVGRDLDRWLA